MKRNSLLRFGQMILQTRWSLLAIKLEKLHNRSQPKFHSFRLTQWLPQRTVNGEYTSPFSPHGSMETDSLPWHRYAMLRMVYHIKPLHQSTSNAAAEHSTTLFPRNGSTTKFSRISPTRSVRLPLPFFPRYASIPAWSPKPSRVPRPQPMDIFFRLSHRASSVTDTAFWDNNQYLTEIRLYTPDGDDVASPGQSFFSGLSNSKDSTCNNT